MSPLNPAELVIHSLVHRLTSRPNGRQLVGESGFVAFAADVYSGIPVPIRNNAPDVAAFYGGTSVVHALNRWGRPSALKSFTSTTATLLEYVRYEISCDA
jgi:hypothetical protein